jgi:hypothetical protein
MRNAIRVVAVWILVGACGPSGPVLRPGVAGDGVAVEATNRTEATICHLRVSRCDLDPPTSYDVLDGATLAPGDAAAFPVPLGCWNFKAEDCELRFVSGLGGVAVGESGAVLELTP